MHYVKICFRNDSEDDALVIKSSNAAEPLANQTDNKDNKMPRL